ncbi:MAG: transglycosylase SLT domain-containing protein [Ignavibacteria bacterium]|nr:transglycosylase SLT domain-containing protein [Ignavibacteria bacterium]
MESYLNIKPNVSLNSLIDKQTDNITRLNSSEKPKKNLSTEEKKEIEKAARGFESIFLNMMYKQMKQSMIDKYKDEEGGMTFGDETLGDYTQLLFADQISKTGTGIGFAEKIYEHLTGGDKLKPIVSFSQEKSKEHISPEVELPKRPVAPIPILKREASSDIVNGTFIDRVNSRLSNFDAIIKEASSKYNVHENLIKAVITAESAAKPNVVSSAGAKGLMQLMDGTAKDLGVRNSFDPRDNIFGGTKYLKQMLNKFDNNLDFALAAYNAGPSSIDKYNGIPPYAETKNYVSKVKKYSELFQNF